MNNKDQQKQTIPSQNEHESFAMLLGYNRVAHGMISLTGLSGICGSRGACGKGVSPRNISAHKIYSFLHFLCSPKMIKL